jgi:hypothetical protein
VRGVVGGGRDRVRVARVRDDVHGGAEGARPREDLEASDVPERKRQRDPLAGDGAERGEARRRRRGERRVGQDDRPGGAGRPGGRHDQRRPDGERQVASQRRCDRLGQRSVRGSDDGGIPGRPDARERTREGRSVVIEADQAR